MYEFCKRLSHLHEMLPFIRVNVEALVDSKSRNFNWSEFLAPTGAKTGYCRNFRSQKRQYPGLGPKIIAPSLPAHPLALLKELFPCW